MGLLVLLYGLAGISLKQGATVTPLGIPFEVSRPELLPVGLLVGALYSGGRFFILRGDADVAAVPQTSPVHQNSGANGHGRWRVAR